MTELANDGTRIFDGDLTERAGSLRAVQRTQPPDHQRFLRSRGVRVVEPIGGETPQSTVSDPLKQGV